MTCKCRPECDRTDLRQDGYSWPCWKRWKRAGFRSDGPPPPASATQAARRKAAVAAERAAAERAREPEVVFVREPGDDLITRWGAADPALRNAQATRVAAELVHLVGRRDRQGVEILLSRYTDWGALLITLAMRLAAAEQAQRVNPADAA